MGEKRRETLPVVCDACGNRTEKKDVHVTMWHNGRLVVIEDVPAQICQACQEQYYDEGTRAAIVRLAENGFPERRVVREMTVSVYSLREPGTGAAEQNSQLVEGR